ncbi:hypothetical protein Tco_0635342 [Tanacetum coccineum]
MLNSPLPWLSMALSSLSLINYCIQSTMVKFVSLIVYVDNIVITRNDDVGIKEFKLFFGTKFLIDLGVLKYFLGIKVIENDLAWHVDIPLPENSNLSFDETNDDKYLSNFTTYQNLVGKLIYLTNTRPDISYVVQCLSQHMYSPLQSHFKATLRTRPSVIKLEEYRSMSSASCEVVWLGNLLHSIGLKGLYHVDLYCDNSSVIQIAANLIFHERTKHFVLDVYFVREKVLDGIIKTVKVSFDLQTADIFTKYLGVVQHRLCCKNLGMLDVFAGEMIGKDSWRKRHVSKKRKKSRAHQPKGEC